MNRSLVYLLLLCPLLLMGCKTNKQVTRLTIASELRDCMGVGLMKCYLVKVDGKGDWVFMYDQIEGFQYEPGYEYVIEVQEETRDNPAADQSQYKYVFVKQLSKVQKTSDEMPQMPLIE